MCLFLFHYSQLTSRQNIVNFRIAVHQLTPRAMKQPSLSSAESGLLFIWRWKHNSFFQLINMWNSRAHNCSNKMKKKHSQPTTNKKIIENLLKITSMCKILHLNPVSISACVQVYMGACDCPQQLDRTGQSRRSCRIRWLPRICALLRGNSEARRNPKGQELWILAHNLRILRKWPKAVDSCLGVRVAHFRSVCVLYPLFLLWRSSA